MTDFYKQLQFQNTFDYLILGSSAYCCWLCNELAFQGFSVLMFTNNDIGERRSIHDKHFPVLAKNFVGYKNRDVHENLSVLYSKAPIFCTKARFWISNFGMSHFSENFHLLAYDMRSSQDADGKHYTVDSKMFEAKEPTANLRLIDETESLTVFDVNEQKLALELVKAAKTKGANIYNYIDLLSLENKEQGYKLKIKSKKQTVEVLGKNVLMLNKPEYINWIDAIDLPANNSGSLHYFFVRINAPALKLNQNHFINDQGESFIIYSESDGLTVGTLLHHHISEDEAIEIMSFFCSNAFDFKFRKNDVLYSWKSKNFGTKMKPVTKLSTSLMVLQEDMSIDRNILNINELFKFKNKIEHQTENFLLSCKFEEQKQYLITEACDAKFDQAKETNIKPEQFKKLFYRYGFSIDQITETAFEYHRRFSVEEVWLRAEVRFCAEYEWCANADDFFERRSAIFYSQVQRETLQSVVSDEIEKAQRNN